MDDKKGTLEVVGGKVSKAYLDLHVILVQK